RLYLEFQRTARDLAQEPRPATALTPLRYSAGQAAELIQAALAPLGNAEYARELAALLDPASGRVDLSGGPNRAGGGGAAGYPGLASTIYLERFGGTLADVSRLAHEAGHAVENQLVSLHRVPGVYARGAPYLSEAYALFSELVLANSLYEKETNPRRRRGY